MKLFSPAEILGSWDSTLALAGREAKQRRLWALSEPTLRQDILFVFLLSPNVKLLLSKPYQ